jgi:hypothetical protein
MAKRRYAREAQAIYGNLQCISETLAKAEKHDATIRKIAEGLQSFVQRMDDTDLQSFTQHLDDLVSCLRGKNSK